VLYNLLGQRLAVPFDGTLASGSHRFEIDLSALPAGQYFYRLEHNGQTATGTLTHLR
jgi:hypothetical protein